MFFSGRDYIKHLYVRGILRWNEAGSYLNALFFVNDQIIRTGCTLSFIITPDKEKEKNEQQEELRSGKCVIITMHEEQITIQKMVPLSIAPGLTSLLPKAIGSPMLCYLSQKDKFEYGTAFKRYCRIQYFHEMQLCCHYYHHGRR